MTKTKTKSRVRLYRFYNMEVNREGNPFALCDEHKANFNPPVLQDGSCFIKKIADQAVDACNLCSGDE